MTAPDLKSELPWWKTRGSGIGMLCVLLSLIAVLSVLTLKRQSSTGAEAGRVVARSILREQNEAHVVVVSGTQDGDADFVKAAAAAIQKNGGTTVLARSGSPREVGLELRRLIKEGTRFDAIAATGEAAKWDFFRSIDELKSTPPISAPPSLWPTFLKPENLLSVVNQTAIYAIIAIGMTMVIITGGIDLSVGSVVALAAVVAGVLIRDAGIGSVQLPAGVGRGENAGAVLVLASCLAGLFAGCLSGLVAGVSITKFRIPAFIATLALMLMARGMARNLADEESIEALPDSFGWLGAESTWGIPNPVIVMIGLYAVGHFLMSSTIFGRYVYAVGGNREAARLSGVPVKLVTVAVYMICGAMAGLGGIMQASKFGSADPKYGSMLELDVIAAVVVGGTSLMGGEGRITGTLIGALTIAVIRNGMNLLGIGSPEQQMILGAVIWMAVAIDSRRKQGVS